MAYSMRQYAKWLGKYDMEFRIRVERRMKELIYWPHHTKRGYS